MNPGNIDKKPLKPNNSRLDRLNLALAKLMGKKGPSLKNNQVPSNNKFLLIILAMIIVLWLLTGIYYIPDKAYGLILKDGKIATVNSGLKIGMTWPYPIATVTLVDASLNNFSFGKESADAYVVATKDRQTFGIAGEIGYKIAEPKRYYVRYYQETSDLDAKVSSLSKTIIQDYFVHHDSHTILQSNSIVISNEIRQTANMVLTDYGLQLDKLKFTSLVLTNFQAESKDTAEDITENKAPLTVEIINQARQYESDIKRETNSLANQFNQLLPQYQANPSVIAELMYYKMLSSIPSTPLKKDPYPLLNLSLEQFLALVDKGGFTEADDATKDSRLLNRNIDRKRVFKDR